MPKRKIHVRQETPAKINSCLSELGRNTEQLEFARRGDIPEEVQDQLVGHATRKAIEALDVLRDRLGFDPVQPRELPPPAQPDEHWILDEGTAAQRIRELIVELASQSEHYLTLNSPLGVVLIEDIVRKWLKRPRTTGCWSRQQIETASPEDLQEMLGELDACWSAITETDPHRVDPPTEMEISLVREWLLDNALEE